jgi:hypothetical protein
MALKTTERSECKVNKCVDARREREREVQVGGSDGQLAWHDEIGAEQRRVLAQRPAARRRNKQRIVVARHSVARQPMRSGKGASKRLLGTDRHLAAGLRAQRRIAHQLRLVGRARIAVRRLLVRRHQQHDVGQRHTRADLQRHEQIVACVTVPFQAHHQRRRRIAQLQPSIGVQLRRTIAHRLTNTCHQCRSESTTLVCARARLPPTLYARQTLSGPQSQTRRTAASRATAANFSNSISAAPSAAKSYKSAWWWWWWSWSLSSHAHSSNSDRDVCVLSFFEHNDSTGGIRRIDGQLDGGTRSLILRAASLQCAGYHRRHQRARLRYSIN